MWFKRRKQERYHQRIVRSKIGQFIHVLQQRWAGFLNAQERNWTVRRKKIYCIVFCLVAGGASIYIIISTLFTPFKLSPYQTNGSVISRPMPLPSTAARKWSITDSLAMARFRNWMDSISKSDQGKELLDSFNQAHPDFIDSFLEMEATILQLLKFKK